MGETLLGHLVLRLASSPENAATEALSFILSRSPTVRLALLRYVQTIGIHLPEDLDVSLRERRIV